MSGPLDVDRSRSGRIRRYSRNVATLRVLTSCFNISAATRSGETPLTWEVASEQCILLCKEYIYAKLSRQGLLSRTLIKTCRSLREVHEDAEASKKRVEQAAIAAGGVIVAPGSGVVSEVSAELQRLGRLLEQWYPQLYRGDQVCRLMHLTFSNENVLHDTFLTVANYTFPTVAVPAGEDEKPGSEKLCQGVTWGRLVSLYAVMGALACECVRQGHGSYVDSLVEMYSEFITSQHTNIVTWILQQGGWAELIIFQESSGKRASFLTELKWIIMVASTMLLMVMTALVAASRI